jgi:hypothetical protein
LLPLIEQVRAYDKEIETLFLTHSDHELFQSLPRAGLRLAPRLLAEIGEDRSRYRDANSLQKLAGTAPVLYASGAYSKAHRRLGCMKPLRNTLQQFAWQTTQSEPWAREYYDRKRSEGKSHTVAVRALANIWVRVIFAMWYNQQSTVPLLNRHESPMLVELLRMPSGRFRAKRPLAFSPSTWSTLVLRGPTARWTTGVCSIAITTSPPFIRVFCLS